MVRESDQYGTTEMQTALLPMLKDFDAFCSANQIRYSLDGGTLLGAIRHNGFIPWDDDVDVMMDRKNFNRFFSVWRDTDSYCLKRRLWVYRILRVKDCGVDKRMPEGVPTIDLFVYDHAPDNPIQKKMKVFTVKMLQGMMHQGLDLKGKSLGYQICLAATYLFGRLFPDEFKFRLYTQVSQWGNKRQSKYQSIYNNLFRLVGREYPYDTAEETEEHVFEEMKFPVTKRWHEYLTITYGDYMTLPPEEQRIPEHMGQPFGAGKFGK